MKTIQRIYLYLVSAISLTAITWAVILLARLVLSEGIGQGQITELASLLAVIIVGLPIFLFHWLIAQRMAARDAADPGAAACLGTRYRLGVPRSGHPGHQMFWMGLVVQ